MAAVAGAEPELNYVFRGPKFRNTPSISSIQMIPRSSRRISSPVDARTSNISFKRDGAGIFDTAKRFLLDSHDRDDRLKIPDIEPDVAYDVIERLQSQGAGHRVKVTYYEIKKELIVKCQPSAVHEEASQFFRKIETRMLRSGYLSMEESDIIESQSFGLETVLFKGNSLPARSKEGDAYIRGVEEAADPQIVVEVGFSEDQEGLLHDAFIWLVGSRDVNLVILLCLNEGKVNRKDAVVTTKNTLEKVQLFEAEVIELVEVVKANRLGRGLPVGESFDYTSLTKMEVLSNLNVEKWVGCLGLEKNATSWIQFARRLGEYSESMKLEEMVLSEQIPIAPGKQSPEQLSELKMYKRDIFFTGDKTDRAIIAGQQQADDGYLLDLPQLCEKLSKGARRLAYHRFESHFVRDQGYRREFDLDEHFFLKESNEDNIDGSFTLEPDQMVRVGNVGGTGSESQVDNPANDRQLGPLRRSNRKRKVRDLSDA